MTDGGFGAGFDSRRVVVFGGEDFVGGGLLSTLLGAGLDTGGEGFLSTCFGAGL